MDDRKTYLLSNKIITEPPHIGADGVGLTSGNHWEIWDCIIDMTNVPDKAVDEAVGITWGCSANFHDCVIRGAGKLILCGCGDDEKRSLEEGRRVTFDHCLLENFSRRGPEVQDGMHCTLRSCVVRNWGFLDKFNVRAFGAWAHKGGSIEAVDCVFEQPGKYAPFNYWIKDHLAHLGQAFNDSKLFGIFSKNAWRSGFRRALTASAGGSVTAHHCRTNHKEIYIENNSDVMDKLMADDLVGELETMYTKLKATTEPFVFDEGAIIAEHDRRKLEELAS